MISWFWVSVILATLLLYALWLVHTAKMKVQESILRARMQNYSEKAMLHCIHEIKSTVVDF